jgi:hypothetical protein
MHGVFHAPDSVRSSSWVAGYDAHYWLRNTFLRPLGEIRELRLFGRRGRPPCRDVCTTLPAQMCTILPSMRTNPKTPKSRARRHRPASEDAILAFIADSLPDMAGHPRPSRNSCGAPGLSMSSPTSCVLDPCTHGRHRDAHCLRESRPCASIACRGTIRLSNSLALSHR